MSIPKPILAFPGIQTVGRSSEIINVVMRSLGCIDNRLIEHGERVAFIAHEILNCGKPTALDKETLFILCVLHDIGAYKTEEIDNMIHFETEDVRRHAAYGYLFLKHMTCLDQYAQAILYHHTDYPHFAALDCDCAAYAQLIFLADRIDVLLCAGIDPMQVCHHAGTRFNPAFIARFLQAEHERSITKKIISGAYRTEVEHIIGAMEFTQEEVLDFLNLLVFAMDFRSQCTVSHTANTTSISIRLGQLFHLSDEQLRKLYYGAAFHDIGKISIPVEILEKAGRLSDEEMAIMRTHVEQSESILRGVVEDEVCDIAVRHHEKLNGSGYPHGLHAADLTCPQRILAVADVMSALSGRRSYKEKFTKTDCIDILTGMKNRGELCPEIVDSMMENYDEIMSDTVVVEANMNELYEEIRTQYEQIVLELP